MKKHLKSKALFSNFIDFLFIVALICVITVSALAAKLVLYPSESVGGELHIRTEYMPEEYRELLHLYDTVFDTLTKRRVGEITRLTVDERDGEIRFHITLSAKFTPNSRALRTKELWFYFAEEEIV